MFTMKIAGYFLMWVYFHSIAQPIQEQNESVITAAKYVKGLSRKHERFSRHTLPGPLEFNSVGM